ncbi:GDSL-type esterase/lipase family protein [Actinoplanes sp. NPDC023714]|uniref:GDSL-type esterase/lipase family protein n=1 Tax=Actinoplanes sp. NPDC023714 TaxID=3154322 RepID=UPI003402CC9B
MTNRRNFIRASAVAGGAVAAGMAAGAATAPAARAAGDGAADRLALLSWHAALANRRYAPAVVAVIGSSSTEGVGSAYGRGFVAVLAENLRHTFPVAGAPGGANFVAAWGRPDHWPVRATGAGRAAPPDDGWALKGWDLGGGSLTHTFTGTSVQVWHSPGARLAVTVDGRPIPATGSGFPAAGTGFPAAGSGGGSLAAGSGGGSLAAGPGSSAAGFMAAGSGPLAAGSHTVTVTGTGRVGGFAVFDGDEHRGIQVWNGGHGGRTTGSFASRIPAWAPSLGTIRPDLVILQLGVNDWRTGVPAATVKRNLEIIITAIRAASGTNPSFVIYGSPRVGPGRAEGFGRLAQAWREVAAEDTGGYGGTTAVSYFDLAERQPPPSGDNRLGLYCDDLIHMTDKGAAHTADALTGFLSPS